MGWLKYTKIKLINNALKERLEQLKLHINDLERISLASIDDVRKTTNLIFYEIKNEVDLEEAKFMEDAANVHNLDEIVGRDSTDINARKSMAMPLGSGQLLNNQILKENCFKGYFDDSEVDNKSKIGESKVENNENVILE